jgi:hypothetical protein
MKSRLLPPVLFALALALLAAGAAEAFVQHREDEYVRRAAREALETSGARDRRAKLTALRDFVRARVNTVDFYFKDRPLLRNTAAETLRTGKGRCGESARLFYNLARAAGIHSQRLYLEGRRSHVVNVVEDEGGGMLIVDAGAPIHYYDELVPLQSFTRRPEFRKYSTFGFRRYSVLVALPSNHVSLGPLVYLLENPHALLSCLGFILSAVAFALAVFLRRRLPLRAARGTAEGFAVSATMEGRGA